MLVPASKQEMVPVSAPELVLESAGGVGSGV